jgi:hypothetical protein
MFLLFWAGSRLVRRGSHILVSFFIYFNVGMKRYMAFGTKTCIRALYTIVGFFVYRPSLLSTRLDAKINEKNE